MAVSVPAAHRAVRWLSLLLVLLLPVTLVACDSGGGGGDDDGMDDGGLSCTFPTDLLSEGANRGAITPVNNPSLVSASEAEDQLSSFSGTDRVLGLPPSFHEAYGDAPLAVPLDVLFESEVMNLDTWASRPLAITFCPLTTSTLVFDREAVDGARFEVSGLLLNKGNQEHQGNLVMVDAQTDESLWPQMSLGATCGSKQGTTLNTLPAVELRWDRWKELYPNTRVAIESNGSGTSSGTTADRGTNPQTVITATADDEVPLGRVLGIPSRARVGGGTGGLAVAFQDLDDGTPARAVEVTVSRQDMVVFWDRDAQAAMAYRSSSSFSVQNGQIVDDQTQSVWTVDGRAVSGSRQGDQLEPVEGAYIAAGRAWFDFQPETERWNGSQ